MESKYWAYTQQNSDGSATDWSRVLYTDPVSFERFVELAQGYAERGGATLTGVRVLTQDEYWAPETPRREAIERAGAVSRVGYARPEAVR